MPIRLLIVDPASPSLEAVERVLTGMGHSATTVSTFHEAKQHLVLAPPDLLVTAVKLGAYNGIQLVLRANAGISSLVIDDAYDPVLEREATSAGAVYLVRPIEDGSLAAVVERLLGDARPQPSPTVTRRWPRKHADMPVDVTGGRGNGIPVRCWGPALEPSGK